ncbi:collagen alpha-1(I) chain-like [Moschus berezovskii]|uniref:collagen alpha-1(I) chain-like n=1 Tax=Moschus berezovskii TaxID=68408 RepID=UPI00244397F1|nr:collagen alpha-1(I) chain-like [Moschus berezovskii]
MPPLCGEMKSPAPGGGARLKSPKGGAARIRGDGCVEMKAGEKCRAACACLRGDPRPGVQHGRGGSQPPGNPSALYCPRATGPARPAPQASVPQLPPPGRLPGRPPPDASSSEPGTPGRPGSVPAEEALCAGLGASTEMRRRGASRDSVEPGPLPAPLDAETLAQKPRPSWGARNLGFQAFAVCAGVRRRRVRARSPGAPGRCRSHPPNPTNRGPQIPPGLGSRATRPWLRTFLRTGVGRAAQV